MSHLSHYSKGQSYTGINLNTFKSPTRKVIMTSFDQYNVSHQAYQQISWMVNLNGIGIWSQSGDIGYNAYTPAITQSYNITLVVYCM